MAPPTDHRHTSPHPQSGAALTVADLLRLPVMERGRPELLAGTHLDRRPVRWVHTSEIYEISPLLKGGEVLLTTGLGLVGAGPDELHTYIAGLAQRAVAALVLEVGRTFTNAPAALVSAARQHDLPLITLHGIVPFIEITESVHSLLLAEELAQLRLSRTITTAVSEAALAGPGLVPLLQALAGIAAAPVRLYASDGHLVATSERGDDRIDRRSLGEVLDAALPDAAPHAAVELSGRPWGTIVVCAESTATREAVVGQGAVAVAVELSRSSGAGRGSGRQRAAETLLRDLFGRQYASVDEVTGRAAALGLSILPGYHAVGVCLGIERVAPGGSAGGRPRAAAAAGSPTPLVAAVTRAARELLGPVLAAELDGSHLLALRTDETDLRRLVADLADALDRTLPDHRVIAVTAGPAVSDIGALHRSLRAAREASVLARRLLSTSRTLLSSDLGVHRLLGRFMSDPELAAFVDEQLGPLLDHDATRGRDLLRTLDTLLACGMSKTDAARRLGIRRQTLYQRLATISTLLGGLDLDSRERRTAIDLALVGWRLRSAAV